MRQDNERSITLSAVVRTDTHANVVRGTFRILDEYVEVGIRLKDARVRQFELELTRANTNESIVLARVSPRSVGPA